MKLPGAYRSRRDSVLQRDDGQSLIEIALVLPVFFLMTFGFIYLCMIMFSMGNANFASRSALRYASLHSSISYFPTTQQDLNNIVAPLIVTYPANTWTVTTNYPVGNIITGPVIVTLTITYTFKVLGHTYTPITYSSSGRAVMVE